MKSIICPKCGKHLINLSTSDAENSNFWCDDCNLELEVAPYISPAYIKKKRRYFIDMDGVLAVYNFNLKSLDELYEEGYFFTRPPHQNIVDAVQYLINEGSDVYILSAVLKDSEFALAEKHEWLDKFMRVPCKQRIFTICGEDKISFVPAFNPSTDVLIDDYGENAKVWSTHGGTYIKVSRDADDASYESSKHQHVIHPELSVSEIIRKIKEV